MPEEELERVLKPDRGGLSLVPLMISGLLAIWGALGGELWPTLGFGGAISARVPPIMSFRILVNGDSVKGCTDTAWDLDFGGSCGACKLSSAGSCNPRGEIL